jgi:hypothetical protein
MDRFSVLTWFIFVLFIFGMVNFYYSEVVDVYLCTNKEGLTTYVGKKAPDKRLNVGSCNLVRMTNLEVRNLRSSYKRVYYR